MTIRVLIADDHAVLRDGLRVLIGSQEDMEVVGEVSDASQVADAVQETRPDIVLLDLTMPGGGGLSAVTEIQSRGLSPKVLVLTMHEQPAYLRQALALGVSGFLVKRVASDHLLSAIRAVAAGRLHIDATLSEGDARDVVEEPAEVGDRASTVLSPREREVLLLVAAGHTNQEAADRLALSVKTVEGYRARIMRKINARNRAELVKYALEAGLLER
jgi:DNA-binding NarL/FixJ family response regulator